MKWCILSFFVFSSVASTITIHYIIFFFIIFSYLFQPFYYYLFICLFSISCSFLLFLGRGNSEKLSKREKKLLAQKLSTTSTSVMAIYHYLGLLFTFILKTNLSHLHTTNFILLKENEVVLLCLWRCMYFPLSLLDTYVTTMYC